MKAAGSRAVDGIQPGGSEEASGGRDTVQVSEEACSQLRSYMNDGSEPGERLVMPRNGPEWTRALGGHSREGSCRQAGLWVHLCPLYARNLPQGLRTDISKSEQTRLWRAGSIRNLQASLRKQIQNRKYKIRSRACR